VAVTGTAYTPSPGATRIDVEAAEAVTPELPKFIQK
jgi:hypothetical protein